MYMLLFGCISHNESSVCGHESTKIDIFQFVWELIAYRRLNCKDQQILKKSVRVINR
jgi:hypothetical protein